MSDGSTKSGVGGLAEVSIDDLEDLVGRTLGPSSWVRLDEDRVRLFADATDDHQWIHLDRQRAGQSPFGGTIAHGYLTLAMVIPLMETLFAVQGAAMAVNYGLERVRFPAPCLVGSCVRLLATIDQVESHEWGKQVVLSGVIEADSTTKPVCVLKAIYRYYA